EKIEYLFGLVIKFGVLHIKSSSFEDFKEFYRLFVRYFDVYHNYRISNACNFKIKYLSIGRITPKTLEFLEEFFGDCYEIISLPEGVHIEAFNKPNLDILCSLLLSWNNERL